MISPTMAHPVISTPLAVRNFKQFEVEADFFAEHFQQIDTESRAALVQVRVDCCVTLSGKIKKIQSQFASILIFANDFKI